MKFALLLELRRWSIPSCPALNTALAMSLNIKCFFTTYLCFCQSLNITILKDLQHFVSGVAFATMWVCLLPAVDRKKNVHVEFDATAVIVKTNVFSKSVIHDPGIPRYSTKNVNPEDVST